MEHLRHLECAPSVQMHQVPASFFMEDVEAYFRKERAQERGEAPEEDSESAPVNGAELYDGEKDQDAMDVDHEEHSGVSAPISASLRPIANDDIDFDD